MGEGCFSGIRIIVIFFNFIFFLIGCGVFAFGIYVQVEKGDYAAVSTTRGLTAALLLIVAGFVTAIISFLGCLGAYKKMKVLLWIFIVLMGIIVLLEIAAFILAIVYRGKVEDELEDDMFSSLEEYGRDDQEGITDGWDWVQRKFECCGVREPKDWYRAYNAGGSHDIVPDTCCIVEKEDCGNKYRTILNGTYVINHEIYSKGCFSELKDFLENHLLIMGILAAVFVVIELVAMVLASLLVNYFKNNNTFV